METQWQRALEMISTGSPDDEAVDRHQSAKKNHQQRDAAGLGRDSETYETPVNHRLNKNCEVGQCGDDKLQSFIDLVIFEILLGGLVLRRWHSTVGGVDGLVSELFLCFE